MIQFTFENIRKAREELVALNRQYKSEIDQLSACEEELINMWEGTARNAFHKYFLASVRRMNSLYRLMNLYIRVLDIVAINYRRADNYRTGSVSFESLDDHGMGKSIGEAWHEIIEGLDNFDFSKIDQGWDEIGRERLQELKEYLNLPSEFDDTLDEFLESLDVGEKLFLDKWAKILADYEDPYQYAPKLLEIAMGIALDTGINSGIFSAIASDNTDCFFDALDFESEKRNGQKIYHVNVNKYPSLDSGSMNLDPFENDTIHEVLDQFKPKDENGWCWQQFGGYMDLYDGIFDVFCNMDANKELEFETVTGDHYTLWLWKGDYWNLGSGGECGFYTGDGNSNPFGYVSAATNNELPMTMSVDYGNGNVINYEAGETWWATTFNADEHVKAEDITITYTVDFSEQEAEIWEAFAEKVNSINRVNTSELDISLDYESKKATIVY